MGSFLSNQNGSLLSNDKNGNFLSNQNGNKNGNTVPKDDKSLTINLFVNQIKKTLGNLYSVSLDNSNYDCEINKLGERNIVGIKFRENIIIITYLHFVKHINKTDEWSLCSKIVNNLDDTCAFIKTFYK